MAADPAEVAFLAAAARRAEEALAGLSALGARAGALPWWLGAALLLAGLLLAAVGTRWPRLVGGAGGGAVGALSALAAAGWLESRWPGMPRPALLALGAAALGVAGALLPKLAHFAAGALPGALLGAGVPIAGWAGWGVLACGAATGAVAVLVSDFTAATTAALLGAALSGAGLLALAQAPAELRELVLRPSPLVAWLLVVSVAGVAAQLGGAPGGRARGGGRPAPVSPPDRREGRAARSPGSPP